MYWHSVLAEVAKAGGEKMLTISEIAVTVTIWILTIAGLFFSIRAVLRKNKPD